MDTTSRSASGANARVAVVIATLGRPDIVAGTLNRIINGQTRAPDCVYVSCTKAEDIGEYAENSKINVIIGGTGLPNQRNAALDCLPTDIDIVVFFDDDFVPGSNWLDVVAKLFEKEPNIVCITGAVLADGILGPGLKFEEADHLVKTYQVPKSGQIAEPFSPYGCNMAFRRSAIGSLRFDERLVLYGWLEDRDFGAALGSKGGRLVKSMDAYGVHMGVKKGRVAGRRLGYSQVVNPFYMFRKGTMTSREAVAQICRNVAKNLIRSVVPEPFIDRRGRLFGNMCGFADLLRGRVDPERALMF
ncbi:glycosyltransferase [Methylobacterium sp. E-005]|uniref:glycosyltransferase family 2 protein n=1 Tax=Methylobacterium sp. E-005 TaxID=2836549 RepID=UPI001FBABE96|nr:glycosyltransferase [Methylobacterium sp. E-005]MCJ2089597.1 glycosyltransferase [Methylobacterium sp. E-005]